MGGVPTDNDGRVRADAGDGLVTGLFAAGEAACVSVHGANRLGTNSLVDLVVFGRRGGKAVGDFCAQADFAPVGEAPEAEIAAELERIRTNTGPEKGAKLRAEMQSVMMDKVSVFRTEAMIQDAVAKLQELKQRFARVQIDDKGKRFNTDLLETYELGCLLDLAEVTAYSALKRTESRGAHSRDDYPKRDDGNWLKHTFATAAQPWGAALAGGDIDLSYRPVVITKFEPKERVY
jgi:succinate dehydrogenase / fumarate reductase flavoprotein subunit